MSQENATGENLYLQVWRNPIFYELLLASVNAEQWQTFTALAVFMNSKGECNPSLSKLKQMLGLSSVASVSRRVTSLEAARHNGLPLITVTRGGKKQIRGKFVYTNNSYRINQNIITIFTPHPSVSTYRRQQMEEFQLLLHKY